MVSIRYHGVMIWCAGSILLAGCSSSPLPQARRPWWEPRTEPASPTASVPPASGSDAVDENTVQAYAHYAQAFIYDLDEEPDQALAEFTRAVLNDPANEELVLELTRRYVQKRQYDKALEILLRATAVPNASGAIFARLGLVYSQMGKEEQAVAATQTAIKRDPRSLAAYQVLYLIQMAKGQPAGAQKILDQAAKVPGTSAEFCVDLAGLYASLFTQAPSQKTGALATVHSVLQRAAKLNSGDPHVRLKLADDYNQMGDTTNASKIYLQLLNKYQEMPLLRDEVRRKLAVIYLRDQDSTNAMVQLKGIVEDDPANADANYLLGKLAYDERKLPEAEEYFEKALLLGDATEDVYYKLAGVQIDLDKPMRALVTLSKARGKFTGGFVLDYLSALAYVREKDYTNAINHFISAELMAKTTGPKLLNASFYFEAGAAFERKGDYEEAEKYFDKSLELSPDFPEALNYLGYMLADRGIKLERARELIEKAVKMEPKSAAYLDSLGWVLYRLKKPEEALGRIQEAIRLSENTDPKEVDPTLYDHLGDVYAALKQKEKAIEAWRKSLAKEPNEQIQKKLEQSTRKPAP